MQKNLRKLKDDCDKVLTGISDAIRLDKEKKKANTSNTFKGVLYTILAFVMLVVMFLLLGARVLPSL